jgi:hypothetical protein
MRAVISGCRSSQFIFGKTKPWYNCKIVATLSTLPAPDKQ